MPIIKVAVNEYTCIKCGHQWINRINGKDGPVPKRCAKCKRANWDQGRISRKEVGLRRRIKYLNEFYKYSGSSPDDYWDFKLVEIFLNLNPRPTTTEMEEVLDPPNFVVNVNSQKQYIRKWYVPIPEKPGWIKRDPMAYQELLKSEAQKRQIIMREIIKRYGDEDE